MGTTRRVLRRTALWTGGAVGVGIAVVVVGMYAAFCVFLVVLLGQRAVPGVPVTRDQMVGTWTSVDHGSITFGADGSLTIRQVPSRGLTGSVEDPLAAVDESGWTWQVNPSQSDGGTALCYETDDRGRYCNWDVTRPDEHLELDLVMGDPDMQEAYRYSKTTDAPSS